jgi:hypothetical protein
MNDIRMNSTTRYCNKLESLLKENEAEFRQTLLKRFAGKDGPPLRNDMEWTNLLRTAFYCTSGELQPKWGKVIVLDILKDFENMKIFDVAENNVYLKHFYGALNLLRGITIQPDEDMYFKVMLSGWIELASDKRFPAPYDLWEKEGFRGQFKNDVLTEILRHSVKRLSWRGEAQDIWDRVNNLPVQIVSSRAWEIARWAAQQDKIDWLDKNMSGFIDRLEEANWHSGSVVRFLFNIKLDRGKEKAEEISEIIRKTIDEKLNSSKDKKESEKNKENTEHLKELLAYLNDKDMEKDKGEKGKDKKTDEGSEPEHREVTTKKVVFNGHPIEDMRMRITQQTSKKVA